VSARRDPSSREQDARLSRAALGLIVSADPEALPVGPGAAAVAGDRAEAQARALWRRHLEGRRRRLEHRLWRIRAAVVGVAAVAGVVWAWDGAGALVRGASSADRLDSPLLLLVLGGAAILATGCGALYRSWAEG
jgi:hypothetical protein